MTRIVILGGGPGGYEAALVAAQHDADVTLIERDGLGGACVRTDCVPSKTLIASIGMREDPRPGVELPRLNARVLALAGAQSDDVRARLERDGVRLLTGTARFRDETAGRATHTVTVERPGGGRETLPADVALIATGASPRVLPGAEPDGDRVLTWRQLYDLAELPEHLIVIGSGVTGAEFVSAYTELGAAVTLVSSRDRVLPTEDADAARVLEEVFAEGGVRIVARSRATSVRRDGSGVRVELDDGATLTGSHALMTVGSVPNTAELGLDRIGVVPDRGGFIPVDRVSRTAAAGVYAAGDCTGVLMLASVAAMQGRIAMWHALGEWVAPLRLSTVSAAVFTRPEVATVGVSQSAVDAGEVAARTVMLGLGTNPRAKMQGLRRGFVKLFCRPATGVVIGGVVVAPTASELILPIALAVRNTLTVDDLAHTFSVYPSLTGSITEAGRQLMRPDDVL